MLDNLATHKEKVENIKKKIKKAMVYPLAILIASLIVTSGLLIFVVPQFQSLFEGFEADLPAMTTAVITLSAWFQNHWFKILLVSVLFCYIFKLTLKRSSTFAHTCDTYLLRCPLLGRIVKQASIARFARTLSITFAAGFPLVDALDLVSRATGDLLYAEAIKHIRHQVSKGEQMHVAMTETNLFPNMVVQMVATGEETGALDHMLTKVADYNEYDVECSIDTLNSLLEPVIMAILGLIIGGLVVSMYMPIFKLGTVV
jgi:type IV pilus assembly protein PilC